MLKNLRKCILRAPNGLSVLGIKTASNGCVSTNVIYAVGSGDEAPGKSGAAHFLEHLSFKTTLDFAAGEFDAALKRMGASNNACTSEDYTHFYAHSAASCVGQICAFFASMMGRLAFEQGEFDAEKLVVLEEERLSVANSPFGRLWQNLHLRAYEGTALAPTTIGFAADVAALRREDVMEFYKRFYRPDNALLLLVGDVSEDMLQEAAEKFAGAVAGESVAGSVADFANSSGRPPKTDASGGVSAAAKNQSDSSKLVFAKLSRGDFGQRERASGVDRSRRSSSRELASDGQKHPRERAKITSTLRGAIFSEATFDDLGEEIFALAWRIPSVLDAAPAPFFALERWLNLEHSSPLLRRYVHERALCSELEAFAHTGRHEGLFVIFGACCEGVDAAATARQIAAEIEQFLPATEADFALLNRFLRQDAAELLQLPARLASDVATAWASGEISAARLFCAGCSKIDFKEIKRHLNDEIITILKEQK